MKTRVILPGMRSGTVEVPSSKSELHRLIIAAALSDRETAIVSRGLSEDAEATVRSLRALGSDIEISREGASETVIVKPLKKKGNDRKDLYVGESGSTLRFLIPLAGALKEDAVFHRAGRLSARPLEPLLTELAAHGMSFREEGEALFSSGNLSAGRFTLPGDVSSQFITGLLLALPVLTEDSELLVTGRVESESYITMTLDVLERAGVRVTVSETECGRLFQIPGSQCPRLPGTVTASGDWSGAAFFLALGALSGEGVTVEGLSASTAQGDREILNLLRRFGAKVKTADGWVTVSKGTLQGCSVDASMIPDLVPVLAVVAALSEGETVITHAERLRLKESDRLKTTAALLNALGGIAEETPDGLKITGVKQLKGGTVSSAGDHRIAMSAAVAAAGSEHEVIIEDPDVVKKSFPGFYEELEKLVRK